METKHVVTCFLEHNGKILILRRSENVGTYRGKWAGISGYVETDPMTQAYVELNEEAGLEKDDVVFVRAGKPVTITDKELDRQWIVHPFLFKVFDPKSIELDWEHTEDRWIDPDKLPDFDTVPALAEACKRVL
jgi:8-oxo-dGTP pyrophosphatase MutT (NUDIX family)